MKQEKNLDNDFKQIITDIKLQINKTKLQVFQNANKSLLSLYFYIGKILVDNSKYGNNFNYKKFKKYEKILFSVH